MPNRRDVLIHALAFAIGGIGGAARGAAAGLPGKRTPGVRSIVPRAATIRRLGGIGDGYKMTLAGDGRQYVVVNDGPGWANPPTAFHNSRLWTVAGSVQQPVFREVAGYPDLNKANRPETAPQYYGHGALAVRGRIYQFLGTLDRATDRPRHWTGAKLIYSDDAGRTWCNGDGTCPVTWEDWSAQSRDHFAFFGEPDGCFSLLSIVQMGRDYGANRDGYIYVYGLNGNVDGKMDELVMFRAPVDNLLDRKGYEFFAGRSADGSARWASDIAARAVAHHFPRGWVNRTNLFPGDLVVESWLPSIVYNEPLGLYMMTSAGIGCAPDGTEFGKPSYFGFWVSLAPWGPWRQVYEDAAWTPGGNMAARAYAPQIAPGWIAADGKSLWLVWADLQGIRSFGRDEALLTAALEKADGAARRAAVEVDFIRRYMPGFSFNMQRVDILLD